jgi:hypothetical protein
MHPTAAVKDMNPDWSKGASESIQTSEPQARIKTPTDNQLTKALKEGDLTPDEWLQRSRTNYDRSWFEARSQSLPVASEEDHVAAIRNQEAQPGFGPQMRVADEPPRVRVADEPRVRVADDTPRVRIAEDDLTDFDPDLAPDENKKQMTVKSEG